MRAIAALLTALLLVVAGCGGAAEEVAERIADQGEGISNVDVEDDSVSFDVETDDGSASVDIGTGDLPDDFPIPIPSGGVVSFSMVAEGTESGALVGLTYPEDRFDELVATWEAWLDAEGFEKAKTESGSGDSRAVILAGNRDSGSPTGVGISVIADGAGNVQVSIQAGDD